MIKRLNLNMCLLKQVLFHNTSTVKCERRRKSYAAIILVNEECERRECSYNIGKSTILIINNVLRWSETYWKKALEVKT